MVGQSAVKPVASPLWRGSDHGPTRVVYSRKRSTASVPCDQVKRHGHFVDLAGCCGPSSRWMRSGLPGQASQTDVAGNAAGGVAQQQATMMTSSDGPMTGRISGIRSIGTAPTAPRPRRRSGSEGAPEGRCGAGAFSLPCPAIFPSPCRPARRRPSLSFPGLTNSGCSGIYCAQQHHNEYAAVHR